MTHPAVQFARLLDPSPKARYAVETYTDMPSGALKPKPDPLSNRFINLSLDDLAALTSKLDGLNKAGAGVFIAVNQFDGQRSKQNLTRVRGVHADFDGVSEDTLSAVRNLLPPTIEVQSSRPENCHFYWLLDGGEEMDTATAEAINRRLVELGADKAAVDVSRLLRLPGFRHMKYRDGGRND
jgi:hypothetical protein